MELLCLSFLLLRDIVQSGDGSSGFKVCIRHPVPAYSGLDSSNMHASNWNAVRIRYGAELRPSISYFLTFIDNVFHTLSSFSLTWSPFLQRESSMLLESELQVNWQRALGVETSSERSSG